MLDDIKPTTRFKVIVAAYLAVGYFHGMAGAVFHWLGLTAFATFACVVTGVMVVATPILGAIAPDERDDDKWRRERDQGDNL